MSGIYWSQVGPAQRGGDGRRTPGTMTGSTANCMAVETVISCEPADLVLLRSFDQQHKLLWFLRDGDMLEGETSSRVLCASWGILRDSFVLMLFIYSPS